MKRFDAIIIGAGQAGPALAGRLNGAGMTVAIIERNLFGGTCVNTGCTPTKTLIASARAAHVARRAADFGVVLSGSVGIDMPRVKARADAVKNHSRESLVSWVRAMKLCTIIEGQARFESPTTVRVGDEVFSSERIFVNVGCRARVPPLPGVDRIPFLTNTSILELDTVPEHLVVVGGSYIGLEFSQMYRRFGSKVTIVEQRPHLCCHEDEDVSEAVKQIMEGEGIDVRVRAECIALAPASGGTLVQVNKGADDRPVTGSHVLLAVGREPNTSDLGLDRAGVNVDKRGYIVVDDFLRTSQKGIWALGDCNGRGAFTHTSYNDFEIVAANLLDDDPRKVSDRIEAYALYIDPALGRAGLTEADARKKGRPILIGKRPMTRVSRAIEKGETQGFMKVVVDAETKKILGAAILGVGGDEAIHSILYTMYAGGTARTIARSTGIHPTVSELIQTVFGELAPG